MQRLILALLVWAIAISPAISTPANYNPQSTVQSTSAIASIKPGMTAAQVKDKLGKPVQEKPESLTYWESSKNRAVTFIFKGGKVVKTVRFSG